MSIKRVTIFAVEDFPSGSGYGLKLECDFGSGPEMIWLTPGDKIVIEDGTYKMTKTHAHRLRCGMAGV